MEKLKCMFKCISCFLLLRDTISYNTQNHLKLSKSLTKLALCWLFLVLVSMTNRTIFTLCTVVKAYQYTSLTSVMLPDCWSIPCVMLLTWIFLKTKYRFKKITGVIVCIAGLVLVVFSDVHAGDRAGRWLYVLWLYLKTYAHMYAFATALSISFFLEAMQRVKFDPVFYYRQ